MKPDKNEQSYLFVSPLHRRIIAFEGRLNKWGFFNRRWGSKSRSPSCEPPSATKLRPTCFTSPIPRKEYTIMDNSSRPMLSLGSVGTRDLNNASENNTNDDDKYKLIQEVQECSGVLRIAGTEYRDVKLQDLKLLADLGSGTCGTVTKRKLQGKAMAVKEMKRTDNKEESKRIFMDLDVIRNSNDCPYIVKCFGYIITMDHLYICMELMASCLEKVLNHRRGVGFPEVIIGKVVYSVTNALIYLKEVHSIMHRDIKPSNILLDYHGNIKLCDFGISGRLIDSKALTMSTGCTAYLAPERIDRGPYDVRADIWSLGITLVQLARGVFPYQSQNNAAFGPFELMLQIRNEEPPKLHPSEGFSTQFCDFVAQCLLKNKSQRPKYQTLTTLPFFAISEKTEVDVGHWLTHQDEYNPPGPRIG